MLTSDENVKPTVVKFPIDEQETVEISFENQELELDSAVSMAEESVEIDMGEAVAPVIHSDVNEKTEVFETMDIQVDTIDTIDTVVQIDQLDETVELNVDEDEMTGDWANDSSGEEVSLSLDEIDEVELDLPNQNNSLEKDDVENEPILVSENMTQNHDFVQENDAENTQNTSVETTNDDMNHQVVLENPVEEESAILVSEKTVQPVQQVQQVEQEEDFVQKNHQSEHDNEPASQTESQNENEPEWRLDPAGDEPVTQKEWSLDEAEAEQEALNQQNPAFIPKKPDAETDAPILQSEPVVRPVVVPLLTKNKNSENANANAPASSGKPMRFRKIYGALLGAAVLTIWFSHQSINAYWQQTYHRESPLEFLNQFAFWRSGASVQNGANEIVQKTKESVSHESQQVSAQKAEQEAISANALAQKNTDSTQQVTDTENSPKTDAVQSPNPNPNQDNANAMMTLKAGDKVIFAGDSIMQGIAPHLQRWLKQRYGIESHNLAKQSTGLAYPKFFDWPKTIEQAFQNDKDIKLLVILLGANDPWDFPNPQGGGAYLKFQSEEWKAEYLSRVNRIIQAAEQADAKIIWVGIPFMKAEKLNTSMRYLDGILSEEFQKHRERVLWLPVDTMLSDGAKNYQDSITIDSKLTRIRAKDGIHFNSQGQVFMSDYLASYIQYQE